MRFLKLFPYFMVWMLLGCTKVKDPEFRRVENFRLKNFGLQEAVIGFSVTYFNPNNFSVTVKEADADIYMDSVYLGKFSQDSMVSVHKNGEFSIPFSGTVSLETALKLNFQNLDQREILLEADGNVKVGKAGIFVNKPLHYKGKHKLNEIDILK